MRLLADLSHVLKIDLNGLGSWAFTIGSAVVIFVVFWIAGMILRGMVIRSGKTRQLDENLMRFIGRAVYTAMLIVGAVTTLSKLGVNISALVAGLGLTGFAVGFALKDVISNALAGILIILYKPFQYGDCVKVSSFEGEVAEIDLRYTKLNAAGQEVFLPNSMLFSNAVTVISRTAELETAVESDS